MSRPESDGELGVGQRAQREVGPDQVAGRHLDQLATGGRDLGEHRAAVVRVCAAHDEAGRLEPAHDRGDRRGVHLQPLPHLAERQRPARGEGQQHQRLVAREAQAVRLEERVQPPDHQLLDPHQRRDRVHRGHAVPVGAPLAGRLVDGVEGKGHGQEASSPGATQA